VGHIVVSGFLGSLASRLGLEAGALSGSFDRRAFWTARLGDLEETLKAEDEETGKSQRKKRKRR
jgi:hypothetical protein